MGDDYIALVNCNYPLQCETLTVDLLVVVAHAGSF